ncbi:MAG: GIY-YIG nuclease family protein [Geobacteraceae bacterium]|nr:GIY-YIG nuclease family protein [Geobacteraceae bacterium]NTW79898.1 GIY-YIG nuclease family protein [Geobacteraceae bacterium]
MNWRVYIILCSDNTLYTGITTDIQRRFIQHASGRGARYFRGRQPVKVIFQEDGHSRSSAGRREVEIKNLTRAAKLVLISSGEN